MKIDEFRYSQMLINLIDEEANIECSIRELRTKINELNKSKNSITSAIRHLNKLKENYDKVQERKQKNNASIRTKNNTRSVR